MSASLVASLVTILARPPRLVSISARRAQSTLVPASATSPRRLSTRLPPRQPSSGLGSRHARACSRRRRSEVRMRAVIEGFEDGVDEGFEDRRIPGGRGEDRPEATGAGFGKRSDLGCGRRERRRRTRPSWSLSAAERGLG